VSFSRLFRRETSRRLREAAGPIFHDYVQKRYPWLDGYGQVSHAGVEETVHVIAEGVARDDVTWYRGYAEHQVRSRMEQGMPPVALLAAGDVLHSTILWHLTPDQRELVLPLLEAERCQMQAIVYEVMAEGDAKGA
jgi:hypothetical protein